MQEYFVHEVPLGFQILSVLIRLSDADLYEALNEDFLTDQISKSTGPIDSQLVSELMELFAVGEVNLNHNRESCSEANDVLKL